MDKERFEELYQQDLLNTPPLFNGLYLYDPRDPRDFGSPSSPASAAGFGSPSSAVSAGFGSPSSAVSAAGFDSAVSAAGFGSPSSAASTGHRYNCQHGVRKDTCMKCWGLIQERSEKPTAWGIFCEHGYNKHHLKSQGKFCVYPECSSNTMRNYTQRKGSTDSTNEFNTHMENMENMEIQDHPFTQGVITSEMTVLEPKPKPVKLFDHIGAFEDDDDELGGGRKKYRKSVKKSSKKYSKKSKKKSSRKARKARKARKSSRK
jgi:hypothetical protein